ncbi:MAG: tetratricopeptide repeat protein [Spirochaetes bacterium]|nr:tetratricopeptide repeat protein [Spirochaetota bacterium]
MSARLSEGQMARFSTFVETRIGLRFSPSNRGELEQRIARAALETGFPSSVEFVEWLTLSPLSKDQLETLASHLTVGETYFWRDKEIFRVFQERVLPELVARRREEGKFLRIWSAGCATGEEPYSIAILLKETIADISEWNVTILATDINPQFIEKAVRGVYRDWSFRDAPSWLGEKYFVAAEDGGFEISPSLRGMVDFRMLNLAEDTYPSLFSNTNAMDLVFCRNVLMYFSPQIISRVVERMSRSLIVGGWLIVSPTEIPHVQGAPFSVVMLSGVHLLRKEEALEAQTMALPVERLDLPALRSEVPCVDQGVFPPPALSLEERLERAADLYRRGLYVEAVEALRGLLCVAPKNGDVLALLARSYANLGRLPLARERCEEAIRADRLSPSRHFLLATIMEEQGDQQGARWSLRQALYADQDFVLAHFSLGHSLLRRGKKREGERHLRDALSLLQGHEREETLPESDGTTVGRLREMINGSLNEGGGL